MTLVFLYGPPAFGKLTVATALARLTGYRVFHNHVTIDMVRSVFDFGEGPFWSLVDRYRVELIEAAAQANIPGVILTFVYAQGTDDAFVRRIVEAVQPRRPGVLRPSHLQPEGAAAPRPAALAPRVPQGDGGLLTARAARAP